MKSVSPCGAETTLPTAPTDGKQQDAEFRHSEAQYRAMYENAIDGILFTRLDGLILAANSAACRLLGRSQEELRTLTRRDLVKVDDARLQTLLSAREKWGRYHGELTLVRGDGSAFEAEVASVVTPTENGTITSMIIRDVTERKCTEARVKAQAQWLDKANEAIFVIGLEHRITYWNQGAERMTGWTSIDVLGTSLDDLLVRAGISDPQVRAAACEMIDWQGEVAIRHRNGRPQVIATSATVLRDEHGRPTGRLIISTDVTEQHRSREASERAQRLQSIGMLAAGVAHDFNNILTPICLCVQMLRERLSNPDDLQLLETVQTSVTRGAAVARQILGFAHGADGEARAIQQQHILREVEAVMRETFPRSITIEEHIPGDVWSVIANSTQLHQLLLNLCINARDAMPEGGHLRFGVQNCVLDADAAARIENGRPGSYVVIFVEDTGTGMTAEVLAQVWEPFFTTKSAATGTGLGLPAVRGIVESHAGFISVQTEPGKGTAFRVFLPAVNTVQAHREADAQFATPGVTGQRILLVEDEKVVREVTGKVLELAGYRVTTASHGAAALDIVQAQSAPFDLVLTDIDMPKMNGMRLAAMLGTLLPGQKIMAMSGLNCSANHATEEQFTAGFLRKPFTSDELLRSVSQALQRA